MFDRLKIYQLDIYLDKLKILFEETYDRFLNVIFMADSNEDFN